MLALKAWMKALRARERKRRAMTKTMMEKMRRTVKRMDTIKM